jgi:hypothetical protein
MDARMNNMEESLRLITHALANAGFLHTNRPNPHTIHFHTSRNQEDRTIRVDIDEFDGSTHDLEVYFEWEASLDSYFEYKETPLKGNIS